jgi:hypothetical protein
MVLYISKRSRNLEVQSDSQHRESILLREEMNAEDDKSWLLRDLNL